MSLMLGVIIGLVLVGLALAIWEFLRQAGPSPTEQMEVERDERQKQFFAKVLRAIRERSRGGS